MLIWFSIENCDALYVDEFMRFLNNHINVLYTGLERSPSTNLKICNYTAVYTVAHRGHSFSVETHSFSVETRCYFMEISLLRAILLLFCHEKPFLHTNTQFLRGNTRLLRGRTQLLRGKTYGGPNGAPLLRRKTCLLHTNACLLVVIP